MYSNAKEFNLLREAGIFEFKNFLNKSKILWCSSLRFTSKISLGIAS